MAASDRRSELSAIAHLAHDTRANGSQTIKVDSISRDSYRFSHQNRIHFASECIAAIAHDTRKNGSQLYPPFTPFLSPYLAYLAHEWQLGGKNGLSTKRLPVVAFSVASSDNRVLVGLPIVTSKNASSGSRVLVGLPIVTSRQCQ